MKVITNYISYMQSVTWSHVAMANNCTPETRSTY